MTGRFILVFRCRENEVLGQVIINFVYFKNLTFRYYEAVIISKLGAFVNKAS